MDKASHWRSRGRGFDARIIHYNVTSSGKLLTHKHSSVSKRYNLVVANWRLGRYNRGPSR